MNWYINFVTQKPVRVLIFIVGITVLLGMGIPNLQIRNNADSELPKDDPIVVTKEKIDEIFGDKSAVLIGIKTNNIYNPQTLKKVEEISEKLKHIDFVIPNEITSLSTVNNVVGREWGLEVGVLMKQVPQTQLELDKLKATVENNELVSGVLVSRDGRFTAIIANLEDNADQATVHKQVYELISKYQGPEILYATGDKIFSQEIDSGVQKDSDMLTPIALLLIMAILYFFFRTIRSVLLTWLAIILSIVWSLGTMGHIGLMQSVVSTMLPALMVIIGGSFAIHILIHYYAESDAPNAQQAAARALRKIILPMSIVSITSSLGAASLLVFKVLSIYEFGIILSIAILYVSIICMTVIPAILSLLSHQIRDVNVPGTRWIGRILHIVTKFALQNRTIVLSLYVILMLASIVGIAQIKTGIDIADIFPPEHRGKIALDQFGNNLGGARFINVMIEADKEDAIKQPIYIKKILEFQQFMEKQAGVGYATSFADVIMQVNKAVNNGLDERHPIPKTAEEVSQYLLLYDMSGDPGDFSALVDYQYKRARIQVLLNTSDPEDHERLYYTAKEYLQDNLPPGAKAEFGGDTIFWIAQSQYVVQGKIENIIAATLIIMIFVAVVYRSISAGLLSIIPVIWGCVVTFGAMGFAGIRLDIAAACISAIAVGIGVDFSVHYLNKLKVLAEKGEHILQSSLDTVGLVGRAILYDACSNVFGFLVVTFSGFVIVQNFGYLLALSMFSMVFATLFMLPVLVSLSKPKFICDRSKYWNIPSAQPNINTIQTEVT